MHAWKFVRMSFIHTYIKLFDNVMSNNRVQLRLFCSSPEQALIFTSLNNLIYQPSYLLFFLLSTLSRLHVSLSNCLDLSLNDKWLIIPTLFPVLKNKRPLRPSRLFWLQGFFQDLQCRHSLSIFWKHEWAIATRCPLSFDTFLFGWNCCLQWFCLPGNK